MVLTTSYLPPIWYFEKIITQQSLTLEKEEHFVKQTIRNRCHILSPNGIQTLIIPVVHNNRTNTALKDIQIANDHDWQRQHWRSINAAYRRSAFFEFYMDDFAPFYYQRFNYLLDFNNSLLQIILDSLKLKIQLSYTDKYQAIVSSVDLRYLCNTGQPATSQKINNYPQVFGYKNGFVRGLSMIDLLFNMGPVSVDYLEYNI